MEFTLSAPYFCFDPFFCHQGAALSHLDSLLYYDPMIWTEGSVRFRKKTGLCQLLTLGRWCHPFLFGPPSAFKFFAKACAILRALRWSRQHQQDCHCSSCQILSRPYYAFLFSVLPFVSHIDLSGRNYLFSNIRLQWVPGYSFLAGNDTGNEFSRWSALLQPSTVPPFFS